MVYVVYDVFAQINKSVSAYLTNTIESAKDEPEDERIMYYVWEVIQHLVRLFEAQSYHIANETHWHHSQIHLALHFAGIV